MGTLTVAGSWNGNYYTGDATNDTATGTDANNGMWGNEGNDNLDGAGGDDAIDGGVGSDDLQGGAGEDRLWDVSGIPFGFSGLIGHDTLRGGDGDDHLNFWSPDTGDLANGGSGVDTLEVRFNYFGDTTFPVSFTLGNGTSVVYLNSIATVAVSNVEMVLIVASEGNDFLAGGAMSDTLAALGGDDVLRGNGGDDRLEGGTGVQDIDGGDGFDLASFDLSAVADAINVDTSRGGRINLGAWGAIKNCEQLYDFATGSGNDAVSLDQAFGSNMRLGYGDDQAMLRGLGADNVEAGYGNDTIDSGGGDDYVDPGGGADLVHLGAGNDQLDYVETGSRASTEADVVFGEDGDDDIYTAAGADRLQGGIGNDVMYAGGGADTCIGGDGNDQIVGEGGADTLEGGDGDDAITADYDYWTGTTPQDNDKLDGGLGNDSLGGGVGQDTLDGGDGDDLITLSQQLNGGGTDTLVDRATGGAGVDTLQVYAAATASRYRVELDGTTLVKVDGATVARATSAERLLFYAYQNGGDHVLKGGDLADGLYVGAGDSSLKSLGGNDTIYTGAGSDSLEAGAGDDSVTGFIAGKDKLQLQDGDDYLLLYDYLSSPDVGVGGALYDGGSGADRIELWLTNLAGSSFDGQRIRLNGDIIGEVKGFESIRYNGATGGEVFTGAGGDDLIRISGAAATTVLGGRGDDTISGGSGADSLVSGDGQDLLSGGAGMDTLVGEGGSDTYRFDSALNAGNVDTIQNFDVRKDFIELNSQYFFPLFDGPLADTAFAIGSAATTNAQRVIYDDASGELWFDADGGGAGAQLLFALLDPGLALTADHFWVI